MRSSFKISLLLLLILPISGFSQFRKYSNEFLNIGAGARGLAMGGAQVASAKDATAGYWNPAGLTGIKDRPNAGLMHAEYFGGIAKYDYVSAAVPIQDNKRALGISLLRFAVAWCARMPVEWKDSFLSLTAKHHSIVTDWFVHSQYMKNCSKATMQLL